LSGAQNNVIDNCPRGATENITSASFSAIPLSRSCACVRAS